MKRYKRLILTVIVLAILLALLLHGCHSSPAADVPASTAPVLTERIPEEQAPAMSSAPETLEPAATELPVPATEGVIAPEHSSEAVTEAPVTEPATEPELTEQTTTEPKPTEPEPTDPKPTEPRPTDPKPTEPKLTEPKPTEPKPTEPAPTEPPHSHSWSDWTQTTAPTCSAAGEEARSCSCGAKETRPLAATGNHAWTETSPTCTQEGVKTCTVCGKTEAIAALGHDWVHHPEEGHTEAIITCYCGMVFSSTDEWWTHFMSFDGTDEIDNHAGNSGVFPWIIDTPAYDICSRCGAVQ